MKSAVSIFIIWLLFTFVCCLQLPMNLTHTSYCYILAAYLILINLLGFFMMRTDKSRAVSRSRRISEKRLFQVAAVGGGFGIMAGMKQFRHKTKHARFVYLLPLMTLVQYAVLLLTYASP